MDKQEFIARLNQMLADLPEEERTEAVSYYEEYFEDAGPEQEAQILEELGSPEQVAAIIRENLYGDSGQGIYTETGYHGSTEEGRKLELERFTQIVPAAKPSVDSKKEENAQDNRTGAAEQATDKKGSFEDTKGSSQAFGYTRDTGSSDKGYSNSNRTYHSSYDNVGGTGKKRKEGMSGETKALLLVLALLFSIPLAAIAIAIIAVIVGVMAAIFGVAVSFVAITGAFLVTGMVLAIIGIANILSASPAGILLCGLGFLFFGAGMLFLIATVFVFKTVLPMLAKGFAYLCRLPFQKRKENLA